MVSPSVAAICKPASILVHETSGKHFWGCCQRERLRAPGPFPPLWMALSGIGAGDQPERYTRISASRGWRRTWRADACVAAFCPSSFWAATLIIQLIQQPLNIWTLLKGTVKPIGWVNSHWHYTENALKNISEPQWVKKQFMHFESCFEREYDIFIFFGGKLMLKEMFQLEAGRRRAGGSFGCLGTAHLGDGSSFAGRQRGFCLELSQRCSWFTAVGHIKVCLV